jgi:hypothetical protein
MNDEIEVTVLYVLTLNTDRRFLVGHGLRFELVHQDKQTTIIVDEQYMPRVSRLETALYSNYLDIKINKI